MLPHPKQDTKDKYLRLQAEFDNFRKRTAAEKDALRSAARGETVEKLLPLVSQEERRGPGELGAGGWGPGACDRWA